METFCDHDAESEDDDLLLNGTGYMKLSTSDKCKKCQSNEPTTTKTNGNAKTIYNSNNASFIDYKPVLEVKQSEWYETRNGMVKNILPVPHTGNMSINLDETMDTPLLRQCNSFEDSYLSSDEFHCHAEENDDEEDKAWRKLTIVCCICVVFMLTELIGGYIAGSLAVMTDAAHLLSDVVGFILSLISIWFGRKSATNSMTFGYHRAEVLGALFSVLVVWLLAGSCAVLAVHRLIKKDYDIEANTMLLLAALGLVINIIMGAVLHGFCQSKDHGHSHHGHSHQHENINVRAAAAHILGDLLQSVGVLCAAIVIKIYPEAKIADPLCTLLFSVIVVWATVRVAKDALVILLESAYMQTNDTLAFKNALKKLNGVKHVHNLHLWSLSPGKEAVSVHLAVDSNCDRDIVLMQASNLIRTKLKPVSSTIQVELYNADLINSCQKCQR